MADSRDSEDQGTNEPVEDSSVESGNEAESTERRRAMRRLLVGGGLVAGAQLPEKWTKPVMDVVILPAHAGAGMSPMPSVPPVAPPVTPPGVVIIPPSLIGV